MAHSSSLSRYVVLPPFVSEDYRALSRYFANKGLEGRGTPDGFASVFTRVLATVATAQFLAEVRSQQPSLAKLSDSVLFRCGAMYAAQISLDLSGFRAGSAAEAMDFYDRTAPALRMLSARLSPAEANALRVLFFNQVTTPVIAADLESDRGDFPRVAAAWAEFCSPDFRNSLSQGARVVANRKADAPGWTMSNWITAQQVGMQEDPTTWRGTWSQPLYDALGVMSDDFGRVHSVLSQAVLEPYGEKGELSLRAFLTSRRGLNRSLAAGAAPLPSVPLWTRGLQGIWQQYRMDMEKSGLPLVGPSKDEAVERAPAPGFHLTLEGVFSPLTSESKLNLSFACRDLLNSQLMALSPFCERLRLVHRDPVRVKEVYNECRARGLVPQATESFWQSFLSGAQLSRDVVHRSLPALGRVYFRSQFQAMMTAVSESSAFSPDAAFEAVWRRLEALSPEISSKSRLEPVVLSAALQVAVAGEVPGFGFPEAYAFSYGASTGFDSVADFTEAHREAVVSTVCSGRGKPSHGFAFGDSSLWVSAFSQWKRAISALPNGKDFALVTGLPAVGPDFSYRLVAGKPPAFGGSVLKSPEFWRSVLSPKVGEFFKGFDRGLVTDRAAEPVLAGTFFTERFTRYVDAIPGAALRFGPFTPAQVRLTPLSVSNKDFLSVAAKALAPQLDQYSAKVRLAGGVSGTILEGVRGLRASSENFVSFCVSAHAEEHRKGYEDLRKWVVDESPQGKKWMGKLVSDYPQDQPTRYRSAASFYDWLSHRVLPVECQFYEALANESPETLELFVHEFSRPLASDQALYRAHHARQLLLYAVQAKPDLLPKPLAQWGEDLGRMTHNWFDHARKGAGGSTTFPALMDSYAAFGRELNRAIQEKQIDSASLFLGLRKAVCDSIQQSLYVHAAVDLGRDLNIANREGVRVYRYAAIMGGLYLELDELSKSIEDFSYGSIRHDAMTLCSPEETRALVSSLGAPSEPEQVPAKGRTVSLVT